MDIAIGEVLDGVFVLIILFCCLVCATYRASNAWKCFAAFIFIIVLVLAIFSALSFNGMFYYGKRDAIYTLWKAICLWILNMIEVRQRYP